MAVSAQAHVRRELGQIISVFGSQGGVGKTSICVALASLLTEARRRVVLVDLTLRLGSDLALSLGVEPDPSFADLAPAMDTMVPKAMEKYLLAHDSGIRLLAAPSTPDRWQRIREGHVEKTIHLLRYRYDFVIVDLATNFDSRVLAVLPISNMIYTVVIPDPVALQNTRELNRLLRLLGYGSHARLVLNRLTGKEPLTVSEMESITGHPFHHVIRENSQRRHWLGSGNQITAIGGAKGLSSIVNELIDVESEDKKNPSTGRWLFPLISSFTKNNSPGDESLQEDAILSRQALQDLVHHRVIERVNPHQRGYQEDQDVVSSLKGQVVKIIDDVLLEHVGDRWPQHKQAAFRQEMLDEILGLGHLETLLRDPEVSEIMVNGANQIYVERQGRLVLTDKQFTNDAAVIKIIERIIAPLGRRIDESSPMVDARLPDGSRVNAIIPPLSLDGPMLTIRKFLDDSLTIADLIGFGSLNEEMAAFLKRCVLAKLNLVVSGGTGSGKTTLLNILSGFIPADERVLTIEDAAELRLRQPHVGRLEARPANIEGRGEVGIRELLRNALRMRPDRIVIGEVRGPETLDMLQAMNTGHDGSMTTAHANSPQDLISRLETMVMMGGIELPLTAIREQIAAALDIIVHQGRFRDGSRRITEISWVKGIDGGMVALVPLFAFRQQGTDDLGRIRGGFQQLDIPPTLEAELARRGVGAQ